MMSLVQITPMSDSGCIYDVEFDGSPPTLGEFIESVLAEGNHGFIDVRYKERAAVTLTSIAYRSGKAEHCNSHLKDRLIHTASAVYTPATAGDPDNKINYIVIIE